MDKPARILDLRDSAWVDGPGRTVLDTAAAIDSSRCELVVAGFTSAADRENEYIAEARRRNLRVEAIRETGALDRKVVGQIVRLIDKYSIDLIHTHDFRSNLFGLYCAKRFGIPIVVTCHGWIANDRKGRIYTATDKFLLRFFDRIIAVSYVMRDLLIAEGVSANKIEVVPNALVVKDFQPSADNHSFRAELAVKDSTTVIANIGRLSPEKGQQLFLRAAKKVLDVYDDVVFVLVGIGEDEEILRELAEANDIADNVRFLGYRADMINVYDGSNLVVQSSSTEGMPNVILESLLMETPVVATDVGGTRDIVEDGVSGCLVEPNSVEQLASGIIDFMRHPDRFRAMAKRGRSRVISHFNHDRRVEALMRIYEGLQSGGMK